MESWRELTARYQNTAECNDEVFARLTELTLATPFLAEHRSHVQAYKLGFGDPAFHAMWRLMLHDLAQRFPSLDALEIGVYKGQVISLWSLIAKHDSLALKVHAISPLQGDPVPKETLLTRLLLRLPSRLRDRFMNADFYEMADYPALIRSLFERFDLDYGAVEIHRGLSTDTAIMQTVAKHGFSLVYVDGAHTYEGVVHDIETFSPLIRTGGFLVMDDASCELPGTRFWKGHPSVSRACGRIDSTRFVNVLNVGHNRVYKRVA